MSYSWEATALEKYGPEELTSLIQQQKEYEDALKNNDCPKCGWKNEGSVLNAVKGGSVLIHFGLWTNGVCNTCKKPVKQKRPKPKKEANV